MYRILLTGISGQVGFELKSSLASLGELRTLSRQDCDLSQPEALMAYIEAFQPHVIVNPAAYTAVDKAESDVKTATAVNVSAVAILAQAAEKIGALLIHYSTDYVFDGQKQGWYLETDPVNPMSVYGQTKQQGEQQIVEKCQRHLIFRTSWVFGAYGANFAKTILRLAKERESLNIVADQFGAPTSARLIADVTAQILGQYFSAGCAQNFAFGTYHLVAGGETTWHQYAQEVISFAQRKGISLKSAPERVLPIPTSAYPLPAPRPANSRLSTQKLQSQFGLTMPDWKLGLHQVLELLC